MNATASEEQSVEKTVQNQSELIYRLEDRPPLPQALFAAGQHLLAMFVAVITPQCLSAKLLGYPLMTPSGSSACHCLLQESPP